MKTRDERKTSILYSGLLSLAICLAAVGGNAQAGQPGPWGKIDKWQSNRLFQPTAHQKGQEARGKVVIYDGLPDPTVDKAMDQHFDRIQNMMFIRVIRTGKAGKPVHTQDGGVAVEDDGC